MLKITNNFLKYLEPVKSRLESMDKYKQQQSDEKRRSKDKQDEITIFWQDELNFNVLDEDGKIKYIGHIDTKNPEREICTCPDQFHRNTENFRASNGFALQCKHLIRAHNMRGDESYG